MSDLIIPKHMQDEQDKRNRAGANTNALSRHLRDLRAAGIKCDLDSMFQNTIQGVYKGEPFAVFMTWLTSDDRGYVGFITTRYKGEDVHKKPPLEVLRP